MQWNIITAQGKTASRGTRSAIASQCWLNARAICSRGCGYRHDEPASAAEPTGRALSSATKR
jgi:hypothetical protein